MELAIDDIVIITDESQYSSLFDSERGSKWVIVYIKDYTCTLKNIKDIGRGSYISLSVNKEHLKVVGHV